MATEKKPFYGWVVTAAAFCTFGLAVGFPYYNIPFFFDYFEAAPEEGGFGWSRENITLGFPLAALLTLWVGPALIHRFSPRKIIIFGTGLWCIAFLGWGNMTGALWVYYLCWFIAVVGYNFSGPVPHQVILSNWFRRMRGRAMGITYVGVGLFGSAGSFLVKPLAESLGFAAALQIIGLIMLLSWPLAMFVLRDRPSDKDQQPDGDNVPAGGTQQAEQPRTMGFLTGQTAFWLLVVGSACSIGSIGAINQHMKFVFAEQGFVDQEVRNSIWRTASVLILWSSIGGRLLVGWAADRFPKKLVMCTTYFLVAFTVPLLLLVRPEQEGYLYLFAILFGFGMGADYMLIPLMAAEQFGVASLFRAMAIILPADTIGQTWFPYAISHLHRILGGYDQALMAVFAVAMVGAVAIALLPKPGGREEPEPAGEPSTATG